MRIVCGKSRRYRSYIPVQTRSRSDKNVVDARLERTSPSANVFIRSEQVYSSDTG